LEWNLGPSIEGESAKAMNIGVGLPLVPKMGGVGLIRGSTGTNNSLVLHPTELQNNVEAGSDPKR